MSAEWRGKKKNKKQVEEEKISYIIWDDAQ